MSSDQSPTDTTQSTLCSAEKCDAEAGGQHDVARRKGGFEFGFGFVGHGWWFNC